MADIVNGGAILLVAAFGLIAIVGFADGFREVSRPASDQAEPEAASGHPDARPSDVPDLAVPGAEKPWTHAMDEERGDQRGDGDGKRDRDDGKRHGDDDDDHDEDDGDEEDED